MGFILKYAFKTVLGRWVTGAVVALLIGGAGLKWHFHKEGLINEGVALCVQEINAATLTALESALADEQIANADLRASLVEAAAVNQAAAKRKNQLQIQVSGLERAMAKQRETDETYRAWSDTTLPSGVADRLREAARSQADRPD